MGFNSVQIVFPVFVPIFTREHFIHSDAYNVEFGPWLQHRQTVVSVLCIREYTVKRRQEQTMAFLLQV